MKTERIVDKAIEVKNKIKELNDELENLKYKLQSETNYTQKGETRIFNGTNDNQVILKHYARKCLKPNVDTEYLYDEILDVNDFFEVVNPNAALLAKKFGDTYTFIDVQKYHTLVIKK